MNSRDYSPFDRLLIGVDQAVRTVFGRPQVTERGNPADGLQDPVESGIAVGEVKPGLARGFKVVPDQVALHADPRQADPDDGRAGKPAAHQIDAFAEDAAHHHE